MLLVAEIGMNHDGHWDRAYELVRRAKRAGADIAKFQFGWRSAEGEINHVKPALAARLKEWCEYHDIEFMTSVITEEGFALARELKPKRYKIASRTVVDNLPLIEKVLAEDCETFVSLGRWTKPDWPLGPPTSKLRYIYCRSMYPCYPADLVGLPESFSESGYYGYSDHVAGTEACLLSLARGARFIEKHFTLSQATVSVHNDHILSGTEEDLRLLNDVGRPLGRLARVVRGEAKGVSGKV